MNEATLQSILEKNKLHFFQSLLYQKEHVLSTKALAPYLYDLKKEADLLRKEPLCELPFHAFCQFDTTGNRLTYENLYFHRRRCLGVFSIMAWLYQNPEDITLVEDYLWAICNEYTWALPAHLDGNSLNEKANPLQLDLFALETAQTLAEITYLLKDSINPAIFLRCMAEIERRAFLPFLSRNTPYHWENCKNNWASVCAGSIGMAAIYCIKDSSRLSSILIQLFPILQNFLDSFTPDGACLEGLSYWTYGVSYFTAFSALLSDRTGHVIDLLSQEKVPSIAAFQGKCYFQGGHTISFSDASCKDTFRIGITSYLTHYFQYKIPIPPLSSAAPFGTDPCSRWCQMFRDFIWATDDFYTIAQTPSATASFPKTCILPDAKWLIFHGANGCGGAIKGGYNAEPHNHNDIGSFFFLLYGKEVLADLGAGEYTKDSFSEKRYSIFTNHSFSHNVPVIYGKGQIAGKEYRAKDYYFHTQTPEKISASMDIAPAYGEKSLCSLIRELIFEDKKHYLTIRDTYSFTAPCTMLEERFISRQKPELLKNSVRLFSESGESCTLTYPNSLLSVSLSTDIHHNHENGKKETIYLIRFLLNQPITQTVLEFSICW